MREARCRRRSIRSGFGRLDPEGSIVRQGGRKPVAGIWSVSLAVAGSAQPLEVPRLPSKSSLPGRGRGCATEHVVDFGARIGATPAGLALHALVLLSEVPLARGIGHAGWLAPAFEEMVSSRCTTASWAFRERNEPAVRSRSKRHPLEPQRALDTEFRGATGRIAIYAAPSEVPRPRLLRHLVEDVGAVDADPPPPVGVRRIVETKTDQGMGGQATLRTMMISMFC